MYRVLKKNKEKITLIAALVLPGGLVVLGLWKAYELYKKKIDKNVVLLNKEVKNEDNET